MNGETHIPDLSKYLVNRRRRFVTYYQGYRLYSMNLRDFVELVKEADAGLLIRKHVIVDLDVLDMYMEELREDNYAKEKKTQN